MHSMNGNMGRGASKGKSAKHGKGGRGKASVSVAAVSAPPNTLPDVMPVGSEEFDDVASMVKAIIPEAGRLRAQTMPVQTEWSVTVMPFQALSGSGGIAIVPKDQVARVVYKVGHTAKPTAMLTVQSPDSLGLVGYPRTSVRCSVSVMTSTGNREIVSASRFLIQLGFGDPVQQILHGEEITLKIAIKDMTARFPERHGWPAGPHPASVIVAELSQFLPEPAISEIVSRHDGSATFLLHNDYIDLALKASGIRGIFLKQREGPEMHLCWLDEGVDLATALRYAQHKEAFGVVEKGGALFPRFAVRFRSRDALTAFALANKIPDLGHLGRWRVSGLHPSVGTHGFAAFLVERGWKEIQILYLAEDKGVFLASNRGVDSPSFFRLSGTARQLAFKALDSNARGMSHDASVQSRIPQDPILTTPGPYVSRRNTQQAFLQRLLEADSNRASIDKPASPRTEAPKREAEGPTGETSGAIRSRDQ